MYGPAAEYNLSLFLFFSDFIDELYLYPDAGGLPFT